MTTVVSSPATETRSESGTGTPRPAERVRGRRGRSAFFYVGIVCIIGAIGAAASWATARWSATAGQEADVRKYTVGPQTFNVVLKEKGELKAAKSTDVACEVEGRSTIIWLVEEGTAVKEGDLLVELASDEIEDRIRQEELKEANAITAYEAAKTELEIQRDKNASDVRKADLEIELKQLELERYEKGDWAQKLKDADIAIQEAEMMLERRKQDFDAAQELLTRQFITQTEYDEDEFNYNKAIWEVDKANSARAVLEKYTHVADLRRKQSDLEEAQKERERVAKNAEAEETKKLRDVEGKRKELELIQDQLAKLRLQKQKCRITAPTRGFVVYYAGDGGGRFSMGGEGQIKEGAEVRERQILMQLPDTSAMVVTVRIHEAKTDKLESGQHATVDVEGLPGKRFTGTVTKIAVLADTQNRWLNPDLKEYETEITLDPSDVPLKPGATAHAEILVETVTDRLAVPVQSIYAKTGKRYVFRSRGGEIQPVPVTLGPIGTEWAQIDEGLAVNEQILLALSDDHKRMIPDAPARAGVPGMPENHAPTSEAQRGQAGAAPAERPREGNAPRPDGRKRGPRGDRSSSTRPTAP